MIFINTLITILNFLRLNKNLYSIDFIKDFETDINGLIMFFKKDSSILFKVIYVKIHKKTKVLIFLKHVD